LHSQKYAGIPIPRKSFGRSLYNTWFFPSPIPSLRELLDKKGEHQVGAAMLFAAQPYFRVPDSLHIHHREIMASFGVRNDAVALRRGMRFAFHVRYTSECETYFDVVGVGCVTKILG
jgi:hypothetical protein